MNGAADGPAGISSGSNVLASLVGDPNAFLQNAWLQETHVHRADDGPDAPPLFSAEDVLQVIMAGHLRLPYVRLYQHDDVEVAPQQFLRRHFVQGSYVEGLFSPASIVRHLDGGGSVLLPAASHHMTPARNVAAKLQEFVKGTVEVAFHLAARGEATRLPFRSDTDKFVLQIAGHRRWEVRRTDNQQLLTTSALSPGDCLYLPSGYSAVGDASQGQVVEARITIRMPTVAQAAIGVVSRLLSTQDSGRRENATPTAAAVVSEVREEDVNQYLESLAKPLGGPQEYGTGRVARAIRVSRLTVHATVRRTAAKFEIHRSVDGATVVSVAAGSLIYPANTHGILSWLAERKETRISEIPGGLSAAAIRKLVHSLIEVGVFDFADELEPVVDRPYDANS